MANPYYHIGRVYGTVASAVPGALSSSDSLITAAENPLASMAQALDEARRTGAMTYLLEEAVAAELGAVNPLECEGPASYEQRGYWTLGYYSALSSVPASTPGQRLKAARKAVKLTQSDVAEALGCTKQYYFMCETDKIKFSKEKEQEIIQAIARAGGIDK